MRTTRIEVLQSRGEIPLVVRSRFERTFFGLGAFAAAILLVGGAYLMTEALIDPIGASDLAVLAAGFALSLSSFLVVYLVLPQRRIQMAKDEPGERAEEERKNRTITVYGQTVHRQLMAKESLSIDKHLPGPM
ncbi:MAG TPA: hypothetical protein VMH20_19250 [Verrucomicrobiae bacterium]|nr:hypothetical protein [Verrucomicrobiae bacterium]